MRNRAIAVAPSIFFPDEDSGASWVQIRPDGSCCMYFPRMEMGQNANTGLAQIVAEELNIAVEEIEGVLPSTSDVSPLAVTAASMSLTAFSRPTAIAAATLRENLRARAAVKFGEPISAILDDKGGFQTADKRKASYADLVDETNAIVEFDESKPPPVLYSFDASRKKTQVGRAAKPLNIHALVTGGPAYTSDVPVEGVLYGRAIQPPVRNARIASLDTSGVTAVEGLVKLVQQDEFVGVVCKTPSAVDAAMAQIQVTWDLKQPINQDQIDRLIDVDAKMAEGDLEHVLQDEAHRKNADWTIDLRFDVQVQTAAAQEPRVAIARFDDASTDHRLEIWTGTQDPWFIKRSAAMDTGLSEDDVVVYPQRMGGSFGSREYYEVERDAVRLARAVKQPVKVQWTRKDEFTASRSRPASAHRLRIATDENGNLSDWWYGYISGHVVFARERLPGWLLPVARLTKDGGVTKGAISPYGAPHQRVEYSDVDLPIDLGVWRSLNGAPATFAIESAMDELALRQDVDPVDFKIAQMKGEHPRLQACLERVKAMSSKHAIRRGEGYGRGFACGIFDDRCFVAVSADIYIDEQAQQIKVLHMNCAQDVGMAVNPGQLRAQIESNLAWSVGMALLEHFEVADNDIQSSNFDNYTICRMTDMPSVDIEIIDQAAIPPAGAGEIALIAGPPAIANAIRNASGFRALSLPISFANITASSNKVG
ncbi:molybdopterin-dependent oxidoreductase [Porticoccaceae bacterium]|nr:molybdopterin-dependent oxidoreductase [Porticoccaceae bacterium]